MVEHKYTHSQFDHCVYFLCLDDESFIYLFWYVDYMLIPSKRPVETDKLKNQLSKEFKNHDPSLKHPF